MTAPDAPKGVKDVHVRRLCPSRDGETGLHCMKEFGHKGSHGCELEWDDSEERTENA